MKHKTTPNRDKIAVRGFSSKKIPREPSYLPNINPHTARWASRPKRLLSTDAANQKPRDMA